MAKLIFSPYRHVVFSFVTITCVTKLLYVFLFYYVIAKCQIVTLNEALFKIYVNMYELSRITQMHSAVLSGLK